MLTVRKSEARGHVHHGWLDTRHTFSFADYYDPAQMAFRALRVINEDVVAPGQGFGMHAHRDMEIVTVVLSGELEHKDSMGTGAVIRPGEVQRMSAGTGVRHSEFNHSAKEPVHLMQIWLLPEEQNLTPSYEQKAFPTDTTGKLQLVVARLPRDGALRIHQDASLYIARLAAGDTVRHELAPSRHAWVQVTRGALSLNGTLLEQGDGAAVSDERGLELSAKAPAEALVFDLA